MSKLSKMEDDAPDGSESCLAFGGAASKLSKIDEAVCALSLAGCFAWETVRRSKPVPEARCKSELPGAASKLSNMDELDLVAAPACCRMLITVVGSSLA